MTKHKFKKHITQSVLGLLISISYPFALQAETLKVFWGGYQGEIYSANPDGSNQTQIYTSTDIISGIDVDDLNEKLYFCNFASIFRMNLDGTDLQQVIADVDCTDIAVDAISQHIYYSVYGAAVGRVNFDGTNNITLVDLSTNVTGSSVAPLFISTAPQLKGIDLDLEARKIYWAEQKTGLIQRANLDGSQVEPVAADPDRKVAQGVVVDTVNDKIYFSSTGASSSFRRANLDGSSLEEIVTGLSYAYHIEVDPDDGKIFFTDLDATSVFKANLDGTNIESIANGVFQVIGLAIHVDIDADNDGTPDYLDACDEDPNKVNIGLCGCGVADVDANENQVIDCLVQEPPFVASETVAAALAATNFKRGVSEDLLTTYRNLRDSIAQSGIQGLEDELRRLRRAITRLKFIRDKKLTRRQFERILAKANAALAEIQAALRVTPA